jgi:5-methylcytosine-specific restriction protein A
MARYVDVEWNILVGQPLVTWSDLHKPPFGAHSWPVQMSGTSIPADIARLLEVTLQARYKQILHPLPEELDGEKFPEGARKRISINAYERDPRARASCIAHYGSRCSVCKKNLADIYGDFVAGLIHVHHIKPLSKTSGGYEVDPIQDLRPICPNCHAVVHANTPPLSIEQVRRMIAKRRK